MGLIKGQLEDAQLELASSAPTVRRGRIYYDTTLGNARIYDSTGWVDLRKQIDTMPQGSYNLHVSKSGNQLSFLQASGQNLSATNPGFVVIQNTASNKGNVILKATSPTAHLFEDAGGTSDISGVIFGTTPSVAWGDPRPFYVYACNSDNTDSGLAFFISPDPTLKESPATTNIAYHGINMSSDSDSGAFFMTATDVTATHDGKPCLLIGGARMTKSAGDDWTITATDLTFGDGSSPRPYEGVWHTFPQEQMGADAASFFSSATGSGPSYATPANEVYIYKLDISGYVHVEYDGDDAGNLSAGGAGETYLHLPYAPKTAQDIRNMISGYFAASGNAVTNGVLMGNYFPGTNAAAISLQDYTANSLLGTEFSASGDSVYIRGGYRAFGGSA